MGLKTDDTRKNPIIQAWALLPRLRALSFVAEAGPASQTGWCGHGVATVTAESAGDDWRLVERGRFTPQNATRPVTFNNVYRWQYQNTAVALWHERFGADAAVFLFELVPAGPACLVSRTGHLCGRDIYSAQLTLHTDGFALDWRIRGPAKDEQLAYRYTTGRSL